MDTITSKMMVLITIKDSRPVVMNQEVRPGLCVTGGTSPVYDGSPGRVYLKDRTTGTRSERLPNEVGMAWRQL